MLFVAEVIAPPLIMVSYAIAMGARFGYERWVLGMIRGGVRGPSTILAVPLGLLVVVGAHRLTTGPRGEPISDELRAMTRLSTIAHAVMVTLAAVTIMLGDGIGYQFFGQGTHVTYSVSLAFLALTAARHLAWAGSRLAAMAARALAAALPAGLVAEYFLTRWTHDAMYNPIPPAHEDLVGPMSTVLWVWKVVVVVVLWRVLAKPIEARPAQEG